MIEYKHRGHVTRTQLEKLRQLLVTNAKSNRSEFEHVVFFDTSIFPEIGDFITGFSRISLKSTAGATVLRIKEGNPSDSKRNGISIHIRKGDQQNLLYILNQLGLKYGYYRPAHRQEFSFETFTFTIKTNCVMGPHFEIKLKKGESVRNPMIQMLLNSCKLKFWSREQYQERITENIRRVPAINVYEEKFWNKR